MDMRGFIFSAISAAAVFCFGGVAFAEPMTFRDARSGGNCESCAWTAAQGEITPETPDKFREYIGENGQGGYIVFNSPGGDLVAGIELGRLIRERGATTAIGETRDIERDDEPYEGYYPDIQHDRPGICASACAFAFMGGIEREIGRDDRLGVHRFSARKGEISSEATQMLAGLSLLHTVQMGVDPAVIVAASAAAPDEIYWFSTEELARFNLDTTAEWAEPWKLTPYRGGLLLETTQHTGALRSVAVKLLCQVGDRAWRMLASEKSQHAADQLRGHEAFLSRAHPQLSDVAHVSLGDEEYGVKSEDVEFESVADDLVSVAIRLPAAIDGAGGLLMEFDAYLAQALGWQLLNVSVELPPSDWLAAAKRNCM